MQLYDVMRTTFAARDFTDAPLPADILHRILDNARFAPSGGNRQGWTVLVIEDKKTRADLAELSRPALQKYVAQLRAGENPWNPVHPSKVSQSTIDAVQLDWPLLDTLPEVPALLVVCLDLSVVAAMDQDLARVGVIGGASIYPFVWNILLSARNEGFGGTITTFLAAQEPAVQELLGLPTHVAVAAMVPLGVPVKQLTKLKRKEVAEFARRDRWDGPVFGSS
jgi:nitroreductase